MALTAAPRADRGARCLNALKIFFVFSFFSNYTMGCGSGHAPPVVVLKSLTLANFDHGPVRPWFQLFQPPCLFFSFFFQQGYKDTNTWVVSQERFFKVSSFTIAFTCQLDQTATR